LGMLHGRCHCGEIQFEVPDQAVFSTICHCHDCKRQSGAPMLAWAMVPKAAVSIQGEPKVYSSSASGKRSFCPTCGTGLFQQEACRLTRAAAGTASWLTIPASTLMHSAVCPRASDFKSGGIFFRGKYLRGESTPSCWRSSSNPHPRPARRHLREQSSTKGARPPDGRCDEGGAGRLRYAA
jgi:hypothetical protein